MSLISKFSRVCYIRKFWKFVVFWWQNCKKWVLLLEKSLVMGTSFRKNYPWTWVWVLCCRRHTPTNQNLTTPQVMSNFYGVRWCKMIDVDLKVLDRRIVGIGLVKAVCLLMAAWIGLNPPWGAHHIAWPCRQAMPNFFSHQTMLTGDVVICVRLHSHGTSASSAVSRYIWCSRNTNEWRMMQHTSDRKKWRILCLAD